MLLISGMVMHVWAEPAKDKIEQSKTPWTDVPKTLHWEGRINGEMIEMTITSDAFVKGDHKVEVEDGGQVATVDGFNAWYSRGVTTPHIKSWTVRWGGKELKLNKGLYTSIFLPNLEGPAPSFDVAHLNHKVWIGPSEDGNELLVAMVCGHDGFTGLIAFTIDKDGKMRRFKLAGRS